MYLEMAQKYVIVTPFFFTNVLGKLNSKNEEQIKTSLDKLEIQKLRRKRGVIGPAPFPHLFERQHDLRPHPEGHQQVNHSRKHIRIIPNP